MISIKVRLSRVRCEWFYLSLLYVPLKYWFKGLPDWEDKMVSLLKHKKSDFPCHKFGNQRQGIPGRPQTIWRHACGRFYKNTQALWSYQNQGIPAYPLTLLRHARGHLTKDTTDLLFWQIYILINFKVFWSYQTQGIPGCLQTIIWRHAVGRLSEPDMLLLLLLTLLLLLRMRQHQSTIFEAFVFLVREVCQ